MSDYAECLVGSILSWFYSLPGISQGKKNKLQESFWTKAALQQEQSKQSIGGKDSVKSDLWWDIKMKTVRSQTPEQTPIHDNCRVPKFFLQSLKSITPSIRKKFGLPQSITFMRQTDSLTKSISQYPLGEPHNVFLK